MGLISSLPYVLYFLVINAGGVLADWLRQAGWLSTANTRRLAQLTGGCGGEHDLLPSALGCQALFLLLIGTVGCGQERLVILYLTLGIGLSGLQYAGVVVNYLDIAPQFVGPVFGLGNTLSCGAGILAPLVMGWLTPHGAREEWQMVFMVTAAVLSAGALFFALLAEGEVQPWARAAPSAKQRALAESLLADSALAEPDTAKPA